MPFVRTPLLRRLTEGAVDLLFPASCLACQAELEQSSDRVSFCCACRDAMTQSDQAVCLRCASRVPELPGEVAQCARCRDQKLWFDRALALGEYDGLLREQALLMKNDRSERLANALGQFIALQFGNRLRALQLDAIVPVPMHTTRRLIRGTNPPVAMAASLSRSLNLPMFPHLLHQLRNTQPQIGLSQPARFRNVHGRLLARKSYSLEAPHVLLVDDILTTGATCSEAARSLKRAGATQVTVLVAARTAKD